MLVAPSLLRCAVGMKLVREATEASEARKEKDKEAGGCGSGLPFPSFLVASN
jgi:hypothetical protein